MKFIKPHRRTHLRTARPKPQGVFTSRASAYRLRQFQDYLARRRRGLRWLSQRVLRSPLAIIGLILVLFFSFVALAAPWLAPPPSGARNPYMIPRASFRPYPEPPEPAAWRSFPPDWHKHPLGLTGDQYDIYYGIIWGTRTAFRVGFEVTFSIVFIGVLLGALAGFFGKRIDNLIMRVVDVFLSLPALIGAIVLVSFMGKGLNSVIIAFIVFGWPFYARLTRGEVLRVKEVDYVNAARASGASNLRIIFRHILPNAISPVVAAATLDIGSQMVGVATLSFLGLGSPEGYADWGQLASFARNWIVGSAGNPTQYWYVIAFPGIALLLFVLSFALLGDAFQEILDPRMRGEGR